MLSLVLHPKSASTVTCADANVTGVGVDRDTEWPSRLDQQAARHRRPPRGQEGRLLHRSHPGSLHTLCTHYAVLMTSSEPAA